MTGSGGGGGATLDEIGGQLSEEVRFKQGLKTVRKEAM